jgi:arsenate reductase
MKRMYGIDMAASQRPKPLCEIPPVETAITMGCNVSCPVLPCRLCEDWDIDAGKGDAEHVRVISEIERKVAGLKERMRGG